MAKMTRRTDGALAGRAPTRRKRTKGEKKRSTRERRRTVARLLEKGKQVPEIARTLGCTEHTVRQHVAALRRAARERAMAEGQPPELAYIADLVEDLERVLQKVREAAEDVEPDKPNYRELLRLEARTLGELMAIRREVAAARPDDDDPYARCSTEELLEEARELGVDTTYYERLLREAA